MAERMAENFRSFLCTKQPLNIPPGMLRGCFAWYECLQYLIRCNQHYKNKDSFWYLLVQNELFINFLVISGYFELFRAILIVSDTETERAIAGYYFARYICQKMKLIF